MDWDVDHFDCISGINDVKGRKGATINHIKHTHKKREEREGWGGGGRQSVGEGGRKKSNQVTTVAVQLATRRAREQVCFLSCSFVGQTLGFEPCDFAFSRRRNCQKGITPLPIFVQNHSGGNTTVLREPSPPPPPPPPPPPSPSFHFSNLQPFLSLTVHLRGEGQIHFVQERPEYRGYHLHPYILFCILRNTSCPGGKFPIGNSGCPFEENSHPSLFTKTEILI